MPLTNNCPHFFCHYLSSHQHDLPKKEILKNEEIELLRGLEILENFDQINEKVGGFDLIKIEEAEINFDKRRMETDYLVNIQSVPNNVVLLD